MAHNVADFLGEYYGDELPSDDLDSNVTVGVAAIQLVGNNARRLVLRIFNGAGAAIVIGRDATVTMSAAIAMIGPGQTLEMNFLTDTIDVTRPWWAIATAAGNAIHILETVLTGQSSTQG